MSSKTRDRLIDVARQLFIRNGVENTTISDIASASDKGRRTIYTYFKNKKEIYNAVIDLESDKLVAALREILAGDAAPADKLRKFFEVRLRQTPSFNNYGTMLRSVFSGDFHRAENLRKRTFAKEEAILFAILDEGIDRGEFDPERCSLLRNFIYRLFLGADLLMMHDQYPKIETNNAVAIIEFIIKGIEVGK